MTCRSSTEQHEQHRRTTLSTGVETVSVDVSAVKVNVTRKREWQPEAARQGSQLDASQEQQGAFGSLPSSLPDDAADNEPHEALQTPQVPHAQAAGGPFRPAAADQVGVCDVVRIYLANRSYDSRLHAF